MLIHMHTHAHTFYTLSHSLTPPSAHSLNGEQENAKIVLLLNTRTVGFSVSCLAVQLKLSTTDVEHM